MNDAAKPAEIIRRRGFMLILSSPSGAGKSTLTKHLLDDEALDLSLSISVTTRARRSSEVDGKHYYFKTRQEFERLRATNDLLEWAEVHGNFYGTPRGPVEEALAAGREMIFDIDYQGTQAQVKQHFPHAVSIFILPPSFSTLRTRLKGRGQDSEEVIERRLAAAANDVSHADEFDYIIVNDDFDHALQELIAITRSIRLESARQLESHAALFDEFRRN